MKYVSKDDKISIKEGKKLLRPLIYVRCARSHFTFILKACNSMTLTSFTLAQNTYAANSRLLDTVWILTHGKLQLKSYTQLKLSMKLAILSGSPYYIRCVKLHWKRAILWSIERFSFNEILKWFRFIFICWFSSQLASDCVVQAVALMR